MTTITLSKIDLMESKNHIMSNPATVYIVDDDENVAKPIARVVEAIGLKAASHRSATEFLENYQPNGPACLVLDIVMPDMSGVVLQQHLTSANIEIPTIVVSAHADVRLAVQVMKNGALDFLEKPFRMQELCESIQVAIRLDRENWRRRKEQRDVTGRFEQLKPPEREVLERIMAGKTNSIIGTELGISVRTVENRRARIMKKLQVESRAELIEQVTRAILPHTICGETGKPGGKDTVPEIGPEPV